MQEDSTDIDVSPAIRDIWASQEGEGLWCDAESRVPSDALENLPGVNPNKKAIWNVMGSLASQATKAGKKDKEENRNTGGKGSWACSRACTQ